jgi:gliding motility-associated-like protein
MTSPLSDSIYSVKIFDSTGCNAHDSAFVRVNPVPTLSVGPDTTICDGLTYTIPGITTGASIVWIPSTGLDNPAIDTPKFHYNDSVTYTVIASDTTGCADTVHLKIGALNCASYIDAPEAFSPNGDGVNDYFTLFANRIADYDVRIYNRWGELVFEDTNLADLNDMSKGWDGSYQGKPQNVGTFVYYLTATDDYGKKISKKGNITLLR